jgi:hypothetical protein
VTSARHAEAPLGAAGARFLAHFEDRFESTIAEAEIARMAAHELDEVERLTWELAKQPLTLKGSRGAKTVNPLIREVRAHRAAFAALADVLKVEDPASKQVGNVVSDLARHAARQRWLKNGRAS